MDDTLDPRELFPAAFEPVVRVLRTDDQLKLHGNQHPRHPDLPDKPLSTRARAILSMELRGHDKATIAAAMKLTPKRVVQITSSERYLAKRDGMLDRMDAEFVGMKPLAFQALRGALTSRDENTALRASEQWMKAAGFMQYGKQAGPTGVTAEDVAKQLLQVNVNVNVGEKS